MFLRDAEQRDGWIGSQEAFLANEDLGVRCMRGYRGEGGGGGKVYAWIEGGGRGVRCMRG